MKSLDANILIYAHNTGCTEHPAALAVLTDLVAEPSDWMLADQTLLEFYRCVRNPLVLAKPLSAPDAAVIIDKLRNKSGCHHCQLSDADWPKLNSWLEAAAFPYRRTFDAVLAVTLLARGVDTLYTHNLKDFAGYGFGKLIDPISGDGVAVTKGAT